MPQDLDLWSGKDPGESSPAAEVLPVRLRLLTPNSSSSLGSSQGLSPSSTQSPETGPASLRTSSLPESSKPSPWPLSSSL